MFAFLVTGTITLVTAPLVARAMRNWGVVDVPNHRSSHSNIVPRGGGLACFAGIVCALIFTEVRGGEVPWLILGVVASMGLIGLMDDQKSLPATIRLAAQVVAGAAMGIAAGGGWWIVLGLMVAPVVVNSVNFMDGINGITSLTMAVWGATAFMAGQFFEVSVLSLVGALAAGAALGFLPWNVPTARLFLGDSGSYLFGALATAGLLIGWSNGVPVVLLLAPLALYLVDTSTVLAKRAMRRESLFEAHREHVYQRLAQVPGFSHARVSIAVAVLSSVITVSWIVESMWVSVATTLVGVVAYLLSPKVLSGRASHNGRAQGAIT